MTEYFAHLRKLAHDYDGLPRAAYINLLAGHFGISEKQAELVVDAWLNKGGV